MVGMMQALAILTVVGGMVLAVLYPDLTAVVIFGIAVVLSAPAIYRRFREINRR